MDVISPGTLLGHRGRVSRGTRMVAPSDHQLHARVSHDDPIKGLDHRLQSLVRAPFAESQNSRRIPAPRKIGEFRFLLENPVHPEVNVVAPVALLQDVAVGRHQHGNRIRQQQHAGGDRSRRAVEPRKAHPGIFQVHGLHQVMQRDVRVVTRKPGQQRRGQSPERNQRFMAEGRKQQVEPDDVGIQFPDDSQDVSWTTVIIEGPAAAHGKSRALAFRVRQRIRQHREIEESVAP